MIYAENKYYLRPNRSIDLDYGTSLLKSDDAIKLGGVFFSHIEVIERNKKKLIRNNYPLKKLYKLTKNNNKLKELFEKLLINKQIYKRKLFKKNKYLIFGILNLTPDSFSDGGKYFHHSKSIQQAKYMYNNGASYIDVGGESTRPGATKVNSNDEILRVMPSLQALRSLDIPVSLDTRNSSTMEFGALSGVEIINDVSGLENDKLSIDIVKKYKKNLIIMHMPGNPKTMMKNNNYQNVVLDVYDYLEKKIRFCERKGIDKSKIIVDPGIGFGKDLEQNLDILRNLSIFHTLQCPIMIGLSRKRFISSISKADEPKNRLGGTISASLSALQQGIKIHRVHDVLEINQSIKVFEKILNQ